MSSHTYREALAAFRRSPLLTALSALMVGLALFVMGLFGLAAHNLRLALQSLEERVEVIAYLREDVRAQELDDAVRLLRELPPVEVVRYVSKAEAQERAVRELPELAEVSSNLEVNPFPASLEVRFRQGQRSSESVAGVAAAAASFPFVEDVRYGQEWVERLFLLRRIGALTAGALGGAFALVAALIIATATRIAVFARKEEIQVMQLVGAREGFIRRPFLLEGALTGLLGGGLAALLTKGTHQVVELFLFSLEWIPASWVLGGVGGGVLFGAVASGLAIRRHLREL